MFHTLATEDTVSSESAAALVAAVAYLGLKVTEAQVTVAVQEVAQATENQLSKAEFLRFSESLRVQPPATEGSDNRVLDDNVIPDPPSSTPVAGESSITTRVAAERPHVEAGAAVTWVFEPRVSITSVEGDARAFAEQVYASVEPAMVAEIDEAVDTPLQIFMSTLPPSLPTDVQRELQQ